MVCLSENCSLMFACVWSQRCMSSVTAETFSLKSVFSAPSVAGRLWGSSGGLAHYIKLCLRSARRKQADISGAKQMEEEEEEEEGEEEGEDTPTPARTEKQIKTMGLCREMWRRRQGSVLANEDDNKSLKSARHRRATEHLFSHASWGRPKKPLFKHPGPDVSSQTCLTEVITTFPEPGIPLFCFYLDSRAIH